MEAGRVLEEGLVVVARDRPADQAVDSGEPQPVGRGREEPGGNAVPPVGLDDLEVADIRPAVLTRQPVGLGQGLDLDEADDLVGEYRREAGAVLNAGPWRGRRAPAGA